ncbi:LexA repressor [Spirochaetia bacterium]|nr:LexA repressor [Spirochaetia bacterium]
MKSLTKRQNEVLSFIAMFISENNYSPSYREIAAHFGLTPKAVHDHVRVLREKGWVRMKDKISRTIEIVNKTCEDTGRDGVEMIQILGEVAAGRRILSEETYMGSIPVHRSMLKNNARYFAVKVRGDSMTGAGIVEGDIAIIEKHDTAKNGDIIVAEIDDGFVLKRFSKRNSIVKLTSENPIYHPLFCDNIRILGNLAFVFRSYGKAI